MWKRVIFAAALLVGIGFVTGDALFGFLRDRGETVSVPSFCGEREESLSLPEWAEVEIAYRYHDEAEVGVVIAQEPTAGSLKKISNEHKCKITLTVSMGRETVVLPEVAGKTAAEAAATLRNLGFSVTEVTVRGEASGRVARTNPAAGAILEKGAEITLYVYKAESAESIAVPDLTGLTRENALLQLYLAGLRAGDVREEESEAFDGTVIRQSPTAGSYVAKGARVGIVISRQIFEE